MIEQENVFKPGDCVRLANGKLPLIVKKSKANGYVRAQYTHNQHISCEHFTRYEYYENKAPTVTKDNIYKVNINHDKQIFAQYCGTDSSGNWLMELIGPRKKGNILIVQKEKCEEVIPYSFSVSINGTEQHFKGTSGVLKKGDILLYTADGVDNFTFAIVKNIDTKNKDAKVWKGVRVITEVI